MFDTEAPRLSFAFFIIGKLDVDLICIKKIVEENKLPDSSWGDNY